MIVAASNPESLARTARQARRHQPVPVRPQSCSADAGGYRKMVADAGRDPAKQMIVVRANAPITDAPLEQRRPLNGSVTQVLEDLRWLRDQDVHTVFFDMNMPHIPLDKQLEYMEQLQQGLQAG